MHVKNATFPAPYPDAGNRDQKDERVNLVMTGDQTQGRFAVVETVVKPAEEPPLHSHTREDEFIYVIEGNVIFHLDGNRLECPTGHSVFLAKGSEHTYCIESEEARYGPGRPIETGWAETQELVRTTTNTSGSAITFLTTAGIWRNE